MDDFVSTVPLLESAITTLVWRWGGSPRDSLTALTEVADDQGIDLGDLAALVLASELQLRATKPARSALRSGRSSRPVSLSVVRGTSVTAPGPRAVAADQTDISWSVRGPGDPGARSWRLAHVGAAPVTRVHRPPASTPATRIGPGAGLGLSRRETEIIALMAQGMSNHDIAAHCYLSINSVKTYIRTAYRKMGVKSRTQALLWAVDHGLRTAAPEQPMAVGAGPDPIAPRQQPLRGLPSLHQMG